MTVETHDPSQLLAAAKDVRLKISPLPPIEPGNAEPIKAAFNSRFDFLELVDSFGDVPKEQLGGKSPGDVLRKESLSQQTARSIYDVMMIASYPPESHQLPQSYQKDFPGMMESIPPVLSKLSLGDELINLLHPQYRIKIDELVKGGQQATQAEYDRIVSYLNSVSSQKTLTPDQRLEVAQNTLSLLVLVSHTQTQHIVTDITIPPDPSQPAQKPLPLSSVAASYLTTYHLGEEMGKMLAGKESIPVRVVEPSPALPTIKPTPAPGEAAPPSDLAAISEKIARGEGVVLDNGAIIELAKGFEQVRTPAPARRNEVKGWSGAGPGPEATPGRSHIDAFRRNFTVPSDETFQAGDPKTAENFRARKEFLARLDLLLLSTLDITSCDRQIFDAIIGGFNNPVKSDALRSYRDIIIDNSRKRAEGKRNLQNEIGQDSVTRETFSLESVLQDIAAKLITTDRRSFGLAEYLLKLQATPSGSTSQQELLLRLFETMNDLYTKPALRDKTGIKDMFRFETS